MSTAVSTGLTTAPTYWESGAGKDQSFPVQFVNQYPSDVTHLAQQKYMRVRGKFPETQLEGEYLYQELAPAEDLQAVTTKHGATPWRISTMTRRRVAATRKELPLIYDNLDLNKLRTDPRSVYVQQMASAVARFWDDTIIAAFFANVATGHDGSSTTIWDPDTAADPDTATSCKLIDWKGKALNAEPFIDANTWLDEAEFMDEDSERYCFIPPRILNGLIKTEAGSSADFVTNYPLIKLKLEEHLGLKFVKTNRVWTDLGAPGTAGSASYWRVPVVSREAMIVAIGWDLNPTIDRLPEHRNNIGLIVQVEGAALRIQEHGVVELHFDKTAGLAAL